MFIRVLVVRVHLHLTEPIRARLRITRQADHHAVRARLMERDEVDPATAVRHSRHQTCADTVAQVGRVQPPHQSLLGSHRLTAPHHAANGSHEFFLLDAARVVHEAPGVPCAHIPRIFLHRPGRRLKYRVADACVDARVLRESALPLQQRELLGRVDDHLPIHLEHRSRLGLALKPDGRSLCGHLEVSVCHACLVCGVWCGGGEPSRFIL